MSRQVFLMKDHVSSYGHVVTITEKIEVDTAASIEELKKTKRQLARNGIFYWMLIFSRVVLLVVYSWLVLGILGGYLSYDFRIWCLLVLMIAAFVFMLRGLLYDYADLRKNSDAHKAVKERLSLLEMFHG